MYSGLVTRAPPTLITPAESVDSRPPMRTWVWIELGRSFDVHVTNAVPAVFAAMEAFQSFDVPLTKKNPLCATVFELTFSS